MNKLHITTLFCVSSALWTLAPSSAQADVHNFHLTGQATAGTYSQYGTSFSAVIGLTDNDNASGLLPARTVSTGDTLTASIQFDRAVDLPASAINPQPYAAYYGFQLGWFDPVRVPGGTTVFSMVGVRFFDGPTEVQPGPAALPNSGCGNLLCVGSVFVPATNAMHFDRVEMTAHIDGLGGLGQVFTVASPGQFSAYVLTPVPEASSAAMLLAGLLAVTWIGGRRSSTGG